MCEEPECCEEIRPYEKPVYEMPHIAPKLEPCVTLCLCLNPMVAFNVQYSFYFMYTPEANVVEYR